MAGTQESWGTGHVCPRCGGSRCHLRGNKNAGQGSEVLPAFLRQASQSGLSQCTLAEISIPSTSSLGSPENSIIV